MKLGFKEFLHVEKSYVPEAKKLLAISAFAASATSLNLDVYCDSRQYYLFVVEIV